MPRKGILIEMKSKEGDGKTRPDIKKAGKRAAQTAGGALLAVSLFFGGLFASPKEITDPENAAGGAAIVQTVDMPSASDDLTAANEAVPERKRTLRERIAERITRLPLAVRVLFVLPAWAVGFAILWAFSLLGSLMGVPILGAFLKWLIGAAVVLGLILLAQKLVFPNIPLKELLSEKNLVPLAVCAGVIAFAGAFGGLLWKGRPYITAAIDICAVAVYTLLLVILNGKRKKKEQAA